MIRVLSIDPPNAWSYMTETEVLRHGRVTFKKKDYARWVQDWNNATADVHGDVIAVEEVVIQRYGHDEPAVKIAKQNGAVVLQRRAGIIEGICRLNHPGATVLIIPTRVWRQTNGLKESSGRANLKASSIALVKRIYGITVSHDEADATLIGRHAAIFAKMEARG